MTSKKAVTKDKPEKAKKSTLSVYDRLSNANNLLGSAVEMFDNIHRDVAGATRATEVDMTQQIGALVIAEEELRIAASRVYDLRSLLTSRVRKTVVPPAKKK